MFNNNNMSKKYQYFARKRDSYHYDMVNLYLCKHKRPHNHVVCKTCLARAGETRQKQKEFGKQVLPPKVVYL